MIKMKMLWMMIIGLFSIGEFENREDFWEWYWDRTPDPRYPNQTLWDDWEGFLYTITLGGLRFNLRMWYCRNFGKKFFGYSHSFEKNGYFYKDPKWGGWWFTPSDGSFTEGTPIPSVERENGNPLFN